MRFEIKFFLMFPKHKDSNKGFSLITIAKNYQRIKRFHSSGEILENLKYSNEELAREEYRLILEDKKRGK